MKYTLEIPVLVLSSIPSASMRLTVASLYTFPLTVLKSSESASDANRTAKIRVPQYFMRRDSAVFRLHSATAKWIINKFCARHAGVRESPLRTKPPCELPAASTAIERGPRRGAPLWLTQNYLLSLSHLNLITHTLNFRILFIEAC